MDEMKTPLPHLQQQGAACKRCNGEGGWERELSSTSGVWIKCEECQK